VTTEYTEATLQHNTTCTIAQYRFATHYTDLVSIAIFGLTMQKYQVTPLHHQGSLLSQHASLQYGIPTHQIRLV
jgi:hypothetical protein